MLIAPVSHYQSVAQTWKKNEETAFAASFIPERDAVVECEREPMKSTMVSSPAPVIKSVYGVIVNPGDDRDFLDDIPADPRSCTYDEFRNLVSWLSDKEYYSGVEELLPKDFYPVGSRVSTQNYFNELEKWHQRHQAIGDMVACEEVGRLFNALRDVIMDIESPLIEGDTHYGRRRPACKVHLISETGLSEHILMRFPEGEREIRVRYDETSTAEHPVLRVYSTPYGSGTIGDYTLLHVDNVNLRSATPLELFAYFSYQDKIHRPDPTDNDYQTYEVIDGTFYKIRSTGIFDSVNERDFISLKFDWYDMLSKGMWGLYLNDFPVFG